jgi:U2 small nuclear ribonucleoprotein A'
MYTTCYAATGNKIGAIENLGATENQFDCIDMSDNAVVKLEGFPRLSKLKALLLCNNRVARVARGLEGALLKHGGGHGCLCLRLFHMHTNVPAAETIPNLEMLILTNNRLENLKVLGIMQLGSRGWDHAGMSC